MESRNPKYEITTVEWLGDHRKRQPGFKKVVEMTAWIRTFQNEKRYKKRRAVDGNQERRRVGSEGKETLL